MCWCSARSWHSAAKRAYVGEVARTGREKGSGVVVPLGGEVSCNSMCVPPSQQQRPARGRDLTFNVISPDLL